MVGKGSIESVFEIASDAFSLSRLMVRSKLSLAAKNLFLRKQVASYEERGVRPQRLSDLVRLCLVLLSYLFDWHPVLKVVKPATLIHWHRNAFRLFWKWKSRPTGRPAVPLETRGLIRRMATENPTWGQARIAAELQLKIGIRLSPGTISETTTSTQLPGNTWCRFKSGLDRFVCAFPDWLRVKCIRTQLTQGADSWKSSESQAVCSR